VYLEIKSCLTSLEATPEILPAGQSSQPLMSVAPEIVKVFFGQSSQWVSEPVEQSAVLYFPDSHVAQVEQPAAPTPLVFPVSHAVHSSAPPTEKLPAGQFSTSSWDRFGFFPADAVLHTLDPTSFA
jgi:hypothetical protein